MELLGPDFRYLLFADIPRVAHISLSLSNVFDQSRVEISLCENKALIKVF